MQGKPVSSRWLALCVAAVLGAAPAVATAQTSTAPAPATTTPAPAQPAAPSTTPPAKAAPATPDKVGTPPAAAPATPEPKTQAPAPASPATPSTSPNGVAPKTPSAAPNGVPPAPLAPGGAPQTHEVEPNAAPQTPGTATMETIQVPTQPIVFVEGHSSYDDAFKSIKESQAKVTAAMDKAGLKPVGHPITIFTDTDDKGFKYQAAIPIAAKPEGKADLGDGVKVGDSPAGNGLKFRHRGPFDEIDSTYDLIVAYLDEKGLSIDPPYIEEYLTPLTTPDDPKTEVDIYTFIRK